MARETSFPAGGDLNLHIIFASYGNDSIALIQWACEQDLSEVAICYHDTGWAAPWWAQRVREAESKAMGYGFTCHTTQSEGMVAMVKRKKGWPRNGMQFCTQFLKIEPGNVWLDLVDPGRQAICMVGVRREESAKRRDFPEFVESHEGFNGRSQWAPLVRVKEPQRNELINRFGLPVLPHRSMECYPCVNSSRADLALVDEARIELIENLERNKTAKGNHWYMFRPKHFMGATGIREVIRWAHSPRGKYEPEPLPGCDSGMCGG